MRLKKRVCETHTKHAGTSTFVSGPLRFGMLMWKLKDQHVCVFAKSVVPHFFLW